MVAPWTCPDELRERTVRLMINSRRDPATRTAAVRRIGERLGVNPETLRGWANQAEVDAGTRGGTTTSNGSHLGELERENRELRRANAFLRSASAFFATELYVVVLGRWLHSTMRAGRSLRGASALHESERTLADVKAGSDEGAP